MIKMRNLLKQILHDSFLYKKRLVLSILGILVATLILNVGMVLVNYQSNKDVEKAEYVENTGIYYGVDNYNPSLYVDEENIIYSEKEVNNTLIPGTSISISLYGVEKNFLDYPVPSVSNFKYLQSTELLYGEKMTDADILEGNKYLYLEESYCSLLFEGNPLGKCVEIDKDIFIVKGVLKDTSSTKRYLKKFEGNELYIRGYTSYTSVETLYSENAVKMSIFKYDAGLDLESLIPSQYYYYSYDLAQSSLKKTREELISDLMPIFVVALMSMSVLEIIIIIFNLKERSSEIGIKRALGATRDEICFEFISEIVIVGIIAILCGIGASLIVNYLSGILYYSSSYYFMSFLSFGEIMLISGFVLSIIIASSLIPVAFVANTNIIDVVKGE